MTLINDFFTQSNTWYNQLTIILSISIQASETSIIWSIRISDTTLAQGGDVYGSAWHLEDITDSITAGIVLAFCLWIRTKEDGQDYEDGVENFSYPFLQLV